MTLSSFQNNIVVNGQCWPLTISEIEKTRPLIVTGPLLPPADVAAQQQLASYCAAAVATELQLLSSQLAYLLEVLPGASCYSCYAAAAIRGGAQE